MMMIKRRRVPLVGCSHGGERRQGVNTDKADFLNLTHLHPAIMMQNMSLATHTATPVPILIKVETDPLPGEDRPAGI